LLLVTVTLSDWFTDFVPASAELAVTPTAELPFWALDEAEIVSVTLTVGPVDAEIELLGKKLQLSPAGVLHESEMLPLAGNDPRKTSCMVTAEEVEPRATGIAASEGAPKVKSTTFKFKGVLRDKPAPVPRRLKL
jgi:hypothetical protein